MAEGIQSQVGIFLANNAKILCHLKHLVKELVKHPNHKGYRFSLEKVLAEMVADSL